MYKYLNPRAQGFPSNVIKGRGIRNYVYIQRIKTKMIHAGVRTTAKNEVVFGL